MPSPRSISGRLLEWLTEDRWLIGPSITRVLLGAWAVYYYLLHYPVRGLLWGPDGVWPYQRFVASALSINPLRLSPSPLYFEVLFHGALAIALAYTLGVCTRASGALHWLMIWSLQERNVFLGDGGDNIMRIALLFLVLTDAGRYFSVDALRRRRPPRGWLGPRLRAAAHIFGVLLVVSQLALLYASTGLYKVMGEVWQEGTALYYILRVDEFTWPGVAEAIYRSPYAVVFGTYSTVLFEVAFLPALFSRWTRYLVIAAGVLFHAGIALFMGLLTFSWSMLSLYPLLLSDREYLEGLGRLRRRFALTAFYDGWCPWCTRSVRWLSRCDLLTLVRYVSLREPGLVAQSGLDPRRLERRIHSVDARGRVREGIDAMIQLSARSPLLWPLGLGFWVCRALFGQRAYDLLASRRLIVLPGGCGEGCHLPGDAASAPALRDKEPV
jgi:predicted DCC family thiol-disulfide oxidoreductase YuxK